MTKQTNELTDLPNGHDSAAPYVDVAEAKAPPRSSEKQLGAFRDLAQRMYTDRSLQRFEAALRALLLPAKKPQPQATVQPPTHNPES